MAYNVPDDRLPPGLVAYDDEVDVEERMFIETLRRGQVAIQRRRQRLSRGVERQTRNLTPSSGTSANESSFGGSEDRSTVRNLSRLREQLIRPASLSDAASEVRVPDTSMTSTATRSRSTSILASVPTTRSRPQTYTFGNLSNPHTHLQSLNQSSSAPSSSTSSTTPKRQPVLLLYCGAAITSDAEDVEGTVDTALQLPWGCFYYTPDDGGKEAACLAGSGDAHNVARGGGCGQLLCARAWRLPGTPQGFESDAPPLSSAVDWLEILEPESTSTEDDLDTWPAPCRCLRAALGCRNCGNAVGVSTLVPCAACKRSAPSTKRWIFWAPTWKYRCRTQLERMYLTTRRESDQEGQIGGMDALRWGSAETPTLQADLDYGFAGLASDWQEKAEAFLRNECFFSHSKQISKRRRGESIAADRASAASLHEGRLRPFSPSSLGIGLAVETNNLFPEAEAAGTSTTRSAHVNEDSTYSSAREFRRRRTVEISTSNSVQAGFGDGDANANANANASEGQLTSPRTDNDVGLRLNMVGR